MDVVILAGGRCSPDLAEFAGVEHRALLPYGGKTMVEIVFEATRHVGPAVVVGGPEAIGDCHVPAGENFIESLAAGIAEVGSERFLLATADLPFLTSAAVDDFVTRSEPGNLLSYPIVDARLAAERFPGMKRTVVRLREGVFTGGNLAVIETALMQHSLPIMRRAYAYRKSPLKLAGLVGVGTLARLALARLIPSTLSIATLERAVSRFLGGPVRAIPTRFPEIGADVDNLEQYRAILHTRCE